METQELSRGIIIGLLIGHGSFGGDGRQPQVTVRMHTRHAAFLDWLTEQIPASKLYGPYNHGGRSYYQWMVRGRALVNTLLPLLEAEITPTLDLYSYERLKRMTDRYADVIQRERTLTQTIA